MRGKRIMKINDNSELGMSNEDKLIQRNSWE